MKSNLFIGVDVSKAKLDIAVENQPHVSLALIAGHRVIYSMPVIYLITQPR